MFIFSAHFSCTNILLSRKALLIQTRLLVADAMLNHARASQLLTVYFLKWPSANLHTYHLEFVFCFHVLKNLTQFKFTHEISNSNHCQIWKKNIVKFEFTFDYSLNFLLLHNLENVVSISFSFKGKYCRNVAMTFFPCCSFP